MHSVFAIFTFDPACLQNFSIVVIACLKESMFLRAMVKSSACCIVFTSLFIFLHVNPSIFSLRFTLIAKISATKRYNIAEIGHPWRIPLDILQVFETNPLFFILKIGFVYNILIHSIKLLPKLNFFRVFKRKFHSTESNAFSKSKKSNIPSWLLFSQYSKMSKINLALRGAKYSFYSF